MADVALKWLDAEGRFDLAIVKGDLERDEGLRTAVSLSLFTDRRVTARELPLGESKRRGWWGDTVSEVDGDEIGSKLWLLAREKQTTQTLERAREYAEEALAWLIEDGVASSVAVSTTFQARGILRIAVEIERPSKSSASLSFDYAWEGESARGTE